MTKNEAIKKAKKYVKAVRKLNKKYGLKLNSDENIYLSFKTSDGDKVWDHVNIGWKGDGTGLKVLESIKDKEYYREQALSKLSDQEKDALGIS